MSGWDGVKALAEGEAAKKQPMRWGLGFKGLGFRGLAYPVWGSGFRA